MRAIFDSLPGLIDEVPNDEAREAIVFAVWPTVLGEHLRERSTPLGFANAVLSIAVINADWKREFEELAGDIIYKLNRAFGKKLVGRIELRVDRASVERARGGKKTGRETAAIKPSPPSELKKASSAIADFDLRTHFLEAAAACIEHRDAK